MIGITIIVALAVLIGTLFLHMSYTYGVMKGYEDGLEDAEQIVREVYDEKIQGNQDIS